jgi:hypothetical protein
MTGHQASRPVTRIYLHLKPRSCTAGPDQSSSTGHSVRAVPPRLAFLSTADYAEQQATSTPTDQHLRPTLGIIR